MIFSLFDLCRRLAVLRVPLFVLCVTLFCCNRSINPVLADGFFQEAEAEAGEQFHGSSAS